MDGTYIREPDGANLLLYSPHFYKDAAYALRYGRDAGEWRTVYLNTPDWDDDVQNEAQYLTAGEWLVIDGPVMEIGGAM